MYVYTEYGVNSPIFLDLEAGDIVQHRVSGKKGVLGNYKRKFNRGWIEWEDGSISETYLTSLVKIQKFSVADFIKFQKESK